jgi:ATP-binding cassette, subfamily A (ABC1), member 3
VEEIKYFPSLFENLDNNKGNLGILSYGVSITTLEEVFLKVANLNEDSEEKKKNEFKGL